MASRIYVVLIVAIVVVAGGFLAYTNYLNYQANAAQNFLNQITTDVNSFNVYKINDCEIIMKQQNLTSALCTMLANGNVVLHDSNLNCGVQFDTVNNCATGTLSTTFNPGDYIGVQVNLENLDQNLYATYYACAESNLPFYETTYPSQYGNSTAGISEHQFNCSPLFKQTDYHHFALSGFVLNQPGSYTIMKIWLFDGSLGKIDFQNNLDKGKVVFDLEGEVA